MKTVLITSLLTTGFFLMANAQQAELKSATANIEAKNYIAALEDLNKAKAKVNSLMTEQLSSVLPQKFGSMEMQKGENGYGDGRGANLYKRYSKPQPKQEDAEVGEEGERMPDPAMEPMMMEGREEITVQITTDMMMANEVMSAHSMSEGMQRDDLQPIRVKGYRAVLRSYGNEGDMAGRGNGQKTEIAEAIVGGAFIRVEARGLKEEGQAKKFLETIDFDKLIGIVGK